MANKTSPHILSSAVNLLGFCLIVITSLHLTNKTENSLIDEFTSIIALLLTVSSVLSFFSIRSKSEQREDRLEKVADYFFMISLIGILAIILALVFGILKLA